MGDFNGTIFDDVDIGVESINALLKKRGLKVFSDREAYKNSFCFPIKKWYEELGFDFLAESYDNVAVQWIKEYLSREHKAGIYEGVREALSSYSNNGARQVIISASETGMLKRQLCELGIYGLFDEVLGKDDIFATGKEEIALKWRSQNKGRALFIGDTDHDLAVAQAIGAD